MKHEQISAASSRGTLYFYFMVDNILGCKEQDEKETEAEVHAI